MIPLRDENPARTTPYVTYALVAVNIVVFLYNGTLGPGGRNPLAGFELVPAQLFTGRDIGAYTPIAPWLTIFTSMFLHANLMHVAGNMLYLWIFGNNVEDTLGHFKFLVFYLLAGLGAAAAQVVLSPMSQVPMVGASGAIAGVLAAYLVLFPGARVLTLVVFIYFIQVVEIQAAILLGWWIFIQIASSVLSAGRMGGGVAYAAHVGGFLTGYLILMLLGGRSLARRRGDEPSYQRSRW